MKCLKPGVLPPDPTYVGDCKRCGAVWEAEEKELTHASHVAFCPTCKYSIRFEPKQQMGPKRWKDVKIYEVFMFATTRLIAIPDYRPTGAAVDEAVVCFTDGTAVAVSSRWEDRPFSDTTPDVTSCDPAWRIYS